MLAWFSSPYVALAASTRRGFVSGRFFCPTSSFLSRALRMSVLAGSGESQQCFFLRLFFVRVPDDRFDLFGSRCGFAATNRASHSVKRPSPSPRVQLASRGYQPVLLCYVGGWK